MLFQKRPSLWFDRLTNRTVSVTGPVVAGPVVAEPVVAEPVEASKRPIPSEVPSDKTESPEAWMPPGSLIKFI